MRSKIANRVTVALFGFVILATSGVLTASGFGLFSSRTHSDWDIQPYVQVLPDPVPPAGGIDSLDPHDTFTPGSLPGRLDNLQGTGNIGYAVYDLAGNQVAGRQPDQAKIPASSMKTITSLGALAAYGPDHRFTTRVVSSPKGIIIVGGGDPFLTAGKKFHPWQASATDLADQVAEALKKDKRTSITLGYDTTLFADNEWNPGWNGSASGGDIAGISALSIDPPMGSLSDVAKTSATKFSKLLTERGITVTSTKSETAKDDMEVLGEVESLPLGLIVQRTMQVSHNWAAEVMFYHVAVASGKQGTYANAQKAMETYLKSVDLWGEGMAVVDGSGLSTGNLIPPEILAKTVRTAMQDPRLVDVIRGMPVAGVEGTLSNRFGDGNASDARGVVHAKTGMLDDVRSLTGIAHTKSGHVLIFSFIVNDVTNDYNTIKWLDQAAAILASS
jgi:D-alanyl-D-alanine carboxypeptidase/D-alanyl-D-alanine-endopeptidase (penicillin-binding protein 4)